MIEMKKMQKLTGIVNTIILGCMILGLFSFWFYGITYMIYHCIFTIIAFILFYYLIYKCMLNIFVKLIYLIIATYMIAATICLGYSSGFHLYCMSLIPLTFYMEYMAYKLQIKKMKAIPSSLALVCIYLASTGYVVIKGPIYYIEPTIAYNFLFTNAMIVFGFLIGYANLMLKLVMTSEDKLTIMAHIDRLTGLFNRHYMMTHLDTLFQNILSWQWTAMVDIDDFKKINDTYGHNCGDYVLTELTKIMKDVCKDCTISRWGGEEFLIINNIETVKPEILEKLRQKVEDTSFFYEGMNISVTITIGVAYYQIEQSLSNWIQSADTKLYDGKRNGKNCVVY